MKNVSRRQRRLLGDLSRGDAPPTVRWNDERGVASVLTGNLVPRDRLKRDVRENPQAILDVFLSEYGALIGPEKATEAIRFVRVHTRKGSSKYRIRAMQVVKELPIRGATLLLFVDSKRGVYRAQSGCYRDVKVPRLVYRKKPVDLASREKALRKRLRRRLLEDKAGARFFRQQSKKGFGDDRNLAENFPLTAAPRHILYPARKGFRHAFKLHAYQPVQWLGVNGETNASVDPVEMVVDIATGRTLHKGTRLGVWSDVTADGRSTLQAGGSYVTRPLLAVREDAAERLLVNRTNTTDIFTHDAGGTETGLETKLQNGTDLSEDANGHWNTTTTSCTAANRRDSQQPETDAHFFAQEAYAYYDGLGWQGFDNGEWGAAACDVRIAAHIGIDDNAYFWRWIDGAGRHFGYLAFYDGECSAGSIAMDFMAGDPAIFAHEYQHAVTYFGSVDSTGDPGYLETTNWHRAIHEGLSDAVAGLRTEMWTAPGLWPDGACRNNRPFRRIEYPRSTDTKSGSAFCDHYDDRVGAGSPYTNSTILSHALFLAGQGGVHERTSRAAELIPVPGAGRASIGAIVHDAVTERFDSIPANGTGVQTMIEAANLILEAAEDVPGGVRSCEYVMLRRAFYAVGLYPFDASYTKQIYGGEACMLPWTISWRHSRPYLGFPAHWWRSPDLFINNGSGVEYDADVGVENKLFATVRNIGDQALSNVMVRFYFRAHGTALPASSTAWKPCKDAGGTDCVLTIPTLAAEAMNITNPASPPASQAVNWHLPASEVVAGVDHFCIRAEITCPGADNHDNDCPYRVQSNVSYTPLALAHGLEIAFIAANWEPEPIPLELEIDTRSLPEGTRLRYVGPGDFRKMRLRSKEEVPLRWKLQLPGNARKGLEPPFEGRVEGRLKSKRLEAVRFDAELSDVESGKPTRDGRLKLEGYLAGHMRQGKRRKPVKFEGRFRGQLSTRNGALSGTVIASFSQGRKKLTRAKLTVKARLKPTRAIHFAQRVKGEIVGGVTYALRWE